jgi:hypothetical protein
MRLRKCQSDQWMELTSFSHFLSVISLKLSRRINEDSHLSSSLFAKHYNNEKNEKSKHANNLYPLFFSL